MDDREYIQRDEVWQKYGFSGTIDALVHLRTLMDTIGPKDRYRPLYAHMVEWIKRQEEREGMRSFQFVLPFVPPFADGQ